MRPASWLLILALGLAAPVARAQERVEVVSVELEGAIEGAILRAGEHSTEIPLSLSPGESHSLKVPFVGGWGDPVPEVSAAGGAEAGRARVIEGTRLSPGDRDALPRGLRSRSLPVVRSEAASPGPARLAWIVAALLLVLGARRRPALALAGGAVAAAGIWLLPAPDQDGGAVTVLELDRASGSGLEVLGGVDSLAIPEARPGWIHWTPASEPLHLVGVEDEGALTWAFEAPGARLAFTRELPGGGEARLPGRRFDRVWARRPGEAWRYREDWELGEGLEFEGLEEAPAPPGWLVSGLPQGVLVWLAEGVDRNGSPTWVRAF